MIDPGAAQMLVRQLNRWYRKRAKPHGTMDLYRRGTRMSYTSVSRILPCFFSLLLLTVAGFLYFAPDLMADKPQLEVLGLKIAWVGIVMVAVLAPLQVFREFVVVTDDGLLKSDLFGRETRMAWPEIFTYRIKSDTNKVVFLTNENAKITMNLAYDGWQDFWGTAVRHMNPALYWQLSYALANIDTKRPVLRSTKKPRWAKWFSSGRGLKP